MFYLIKYLELLIIFIKVVKCIIKDIFKYLTNFDIYCLLIYRLVLIYMYYNILIYIIYRYVIYIYINFISQ